MTSDRGRDPTSSPGLFPPKMGNFLREKPWGRGWARSIQPKFPEISVQNSMDRFGLTGKFRKNCFTFWGGPLFAVGPVWILVECRIAPQFRRNFCGWTEPIHWVFDWNFQKCLLNGSRRGAHNPLQYGCQWNMYPLPPPPPLTPPHTCRFYFCCYEQHNGQKSKDSRQNNRKAVSGEFISS